MSIETRERPAGIWVVAIVAIVLGGLGSCGGLYGLVTVAAQERLSEFQRGLQANQPNDALRQANDDVQERMLEIARTWRIPIVIGHIINLIACAALLVGAILLFRWHPNAAAIFMGAVVLSIIADLVLGGVGAVVQQETFAVMDDFGRQLGAASGGDPAAERVTTGAMRAASTVGICFSVGWLIAKLGFYVSALVYLRRESVRILFR